VELVCIGMEDKLCGTGLYRFGGAHCVELDCIGLAANCVELECTVLGANCAELDSIGLGGKLCGTGMYRFGAN
jgi:hypothetical protein